MTDFDQAVQELLEALPVLPFVDTPRGTQPLSPMSTEGRGTEEGERRGPATVALGSLPGIEEDGRHGGRTRVVGVESQRVKLYMKEPKAFDRKNFKDFYRSVNLFILSNRKDFETDERKILFVLSFMTEGLAGSWAQNEIDAAMYDTKGEERVPPQWEDWTTFTKKMIVAFGDPSEKKTYQVKLEQL